MLTPEEAARAGAPDSQVIELTMESAKAKVDKAMAVERLRKNPDFINLITEGYLRDEAVRLVQSKSLEMNRLPQDQESINTDIMAIGSFINYLNTIVQHGEMAQGAIEQATEEFEMALAEEAGEGN